MLFWYNLKTTLYHRLVKVKQNFFEYIGRENFFNFLINYYFFLYHFFKVYQKT